ncbi:hypothetical protein [Thalassobaculum salexigens]|uniref:hypothetical protein n=1 Tax=Thalassobaculum salexigens TaxID=455360 RepID=UPI00048A6A81|nr:hypothetical protein [Thalassobaculum salexigens]
MSEVKTIDVSSVSFSSTVFPSDADMELWNSLSEKEQRAVVRRDLDAAEASGVAEPETAAEILERVRSSPLE